MKRGGRCARDGEDLAYAILRSIRRILRRVADHSRDLSRAAGLTIPQLLCLRAIAEEAAARPATAAAICRHVRLSAPTVSRILDRLEGAGLLLRARDRVDRRRVLLTLSPAGRAALRRSPTPIQEEFLARLRALPRRDRGRLLESLEEIVRLMEAADIDAAPLIAPGDQPRSR